MLSKAVVDRPMSRLSIITCATLPEVKSTKTNLWQGKLYRWSGSAHVTSVPATDVTGQLTSAHIASLEATKLAGQITSTQIGTGAVLNAALADAAISFSKLVGSAVTAAKIADGAFTNAKFASCIRPVEIVSALPSSGNFDGRQAYLTSDKQLYRHHGTAWVNSNALDQIVGQLVAGQIATGAIVASKLAATDMTRFDHVFVMDRQNLRDAEACRKAGVQPELFLSLTPDCGHIDMPDPWYTGSYDLTVRLCEAAADALIALLVKG